MAAPLSDPALDQIFREARTRNGWNPEPLPESLLHEIYDLAKFGPTAANSSPARFVFATSPEAKAKLSALSSGNNQGKILEAPCTVIIGYDVDFMDHNAKLLPHAPTMLAGLKGTPHADPMAFRNSSLQGAYLMVAARALGLDAGPMSGFDNAGVDAAFFAGTAIKSNFICSLGYGTDANLFPRNPRLTFDEACRIE